MHQKQIQLEIFENGSKAKTVEKINSDMPKNLSADKFPVKFCIVIAYSILLSIISFAAGIEHGKAIPKKIAEAAKQISTTNTAIQTTSKTNGMDSIKNNAVQKPSSVETSININNKKIEKKEKDDILTSGYIIQVATYKKNSSHAQDEISKLKQKGYKTVVIPSGEYIQICAGKFTNKNDAQSHLAKLKRIYKDCFIRKI